MNRDDPGFLIDCRTLVELLTDYLEGALEEPALTRLERHLEVCPPCRDYLDQLRATIRALGAVPAVDQLPPATRDGLLAAFRELQPGG
ncbi:MAG: anti-sigma factor family protein [Frankiaceae bacterium]